MSELWDAEVNMNIRRFVKTVPQAVMSILELPCCQARNRNLILCDQQRVVLPPTLYPGQYTAEYRENQSPRGMGDARHWKTAQDSASQRMRTKCLKKPVRPSLGAAGAANGIGTWKACRTCKTLSSLNSSPELSFRRGGCVEMDKQGPRHHPH